jgi:ABC-type dipeptide/oligopeptide/nickel transport system permease subunit
MTQQIANAINDSLRPAGVAVLIGVPLGIFAGYAGGRTREA